MGRTVHSGKSDDADVIVVGAGPGGSSAAYHCAAAGLSVLLLDKASFPRDKICGDGLTPRAVAELVRMGVPTRAEDGWIRNHGLRIIGGGLKLQLPWPELASFPDGKLAVRSVGDVPVLLYRTGERVTAMIERGAKTLSAGRGMPEVKARLGFTIRPLHLAVVPRVVAGR